MPKTLNDWFCLKSNRHSFKPNVMRDREFVFCHQSTIQDEILSSIERRFATMHPVKMVLYGDWGVGKTHTIYYISYWLEQNSKDYPSRTVLVELGDITSKSKFDVLVGPFLEKLELREIVRLVHAYQPSAGTHVIDGLKATGVAPNVAEAFGKFLLAPPGATPPSAVISAFDFLKGQKPRDASAIGLGPPLTQSEEFYSVLLACGELVRAVEQRQLVFIADEAAKLEDIESDDASRRHWISANRLIFDDNNPIFGFIYTLSGRGRKTIPVVIHDSQIINRLGPNNLIELRNLPSTAVEHFLTSLREAFVDREAVEKLVAAGEIASAEYQWEHYPFTHNGWNNFIDYWNQNQEDAKPRDICDKLDDAGFRALKDTKRLIDPACLQKAGM